jgi:2-oxoglutarate dehydrogenase E1 component
MAGMKNPEIFWVQEEPENMGSWSYILRHMRRTNIEVISRKESASPATGFAKVHAKEQQSILDQAFAK